MEFVPNNIFDLLTIAPHFVPEVLQKPSIRNPIAVSLGAIAGSLGRYYLSLWLPQILGVDFPYATLLVNLSGSFAMGIVATLVLERASVIAPEVRLLMAIGVLMQSLRTLCVPVVEDDDLSLRLCGETPKTALHRFLGSYTTFSSYELDTINLIRFSWQRAIFYWFGSAVCGFLCLYLGILFARVIK